MTENIITLTIEKLAGLGDGAGRHASRQVFVPYTLPGDVVRARITRETKDASYAVLEEIITPGPGRTQAPCRHFAQCGGCALQHLDKEVYYAFKQEMACEAVRKAGYSSEQVEPLIRLDAASRRRVELKVEEGRLGFYAERSHRLVDIEECKVLELDLEALLMRLKPELVALKQLSSIQINGVDGGYDILLNGPEFQKWQLKNDHAVVRVSANQGGKLRTLNQPRPVQVTLGQIQVTPPPGAFLQASRQAQAIMTEFVLKGTEGALRVLDLFAGLGTYSFPLAGRTDVTAIENDAPMIKALEATARKYGLAKLKTERRDLFHHPLNPRELSYYDAVVINPPRMGAKEQAHALAAAKVKKLVMISCNPATFTRDARLLKEGGYRLEKLVPLDQFFYSSHLEILAEFSL